MSIAEVTTVCVHSGEPGLVGWLAVVVGGAPELRMVLAEAGPDIALVDDRLPEVVDAVCSVKAAGQRCLVLSDGADPDRLVAALGAGPDGCVARDTDAVVMRSNLVAAARGTYQLPGPAWQRLASTVARGLAAAPAAAPLIDRATLEDVIANRRFELVFQPIVDVRSGETVALESLARFTAEPSQPPNVWLAQADEAGLRIALEHELLRAAVAVMAQVPREIAVSANLSPEAALDAALPAVLDGAPLDRLILEITDHRQLGDYEPLSEALAELRGAGLRLAVDDSGHGLSSLQQVAQLAPSFMKLNRTLTRNVDRDPTKRALAYALSTFAAQLGASIVAEGLETEGELRTVRALGARFGQGFLLARPRPLAELDLGGATALPFPGDDDGEPVEPTGPVLELRGAAREDFREATRAALRFLGDLQPAVTFVVAHLDYVRRRHTIVGARGPMAAALEPGRSSPLQDTMCFHMAAGLGARLCPDVDEDVVYGALPFARQLDVGAYMGVPLELPEGTRFGSLFAMSRGPLGVSAQDLALLDAVAAILGTILLKQTAGMDRGAFLRFLRALARTDGLTGALNAPGFTEELTTEIGRPVARRTGSYVSVQVEDLESLRAKYGRAVADLVLKDVASALAVSTQKPDLVGRVGENRFGVLLVRQAHPDGVPQLLSSLRPRLADSAARREISMSVRTGSVALAALDGPGQAWDQAVAGAERLK